MKRILLILLLIIPWLFLTSSFKIVPNGIPDFIASKMKNYNYYLLSIPPGKYTLIVVYSNPIISKSDILKNKRIEIGIFPDLRYISSSSINAYKLFSEIPDKGKTKIFESKFITDTNPLTFNPLPFCMYFAVSTAQDNVIYNSNIDHKYIMIFKHKQKDEFLVFFDINFDNLFSDLIVLINFISVCSGGGRGDSQGNSPF
ncbi:MAG: hypothetical protein ABDH21_05675 [bacterium]